MDPGKADRAADGSGLPRTRGDGPLSHHPYSSGSMASPHTRGWTHTLAAQHRPPRGFPAHAGMDPASPDAPSSSTRLPRTRGDGPDSLCVSPRRSRASPHTRGWTPGRHRHDTHPVGFPAHAGMDPGEYTGRSMTTGLPRTRRTRGDESCEWPASPWPPTASDGPSGHVRTALRPFGPRVGSAPTLPIAMPSGTVASDVENLTRAPVT